MYTNIILNSNSISEAWTDINHQYHGDMWEAFIGLAYISKACVIQEDLLQYKCGHLKEKDTFTQQEA